MQNHNLKFKILEHITDLKIRVLGKTKKDLFRNALEAMTFCQKAKTKNENIRKRRIKIKSIDLDALLVDFLSEALCLGQINKEIYNDIKFTKFSPSNSSGQAEFEAELIGNKIESFGEDIKAVTYHGLKIDQPRLASGEAGQKNGLYEATILFDI